MEPSELYLKLMTETAKVQWSEVAPLYTRGVLLRVVGDLDLVSVAEAIANDDTVQVASWTSAGLLDRLPQDAADDYASRDATLWAVVVAPWVIVQAR